MKSLRRQRGISLFNLMLLLVVGGFMAVMVVRVAPLYMEWMSVRSVIDAMAHERGEHVRDPNAIVQTVFKRFAVNNVDRVKRDAITVTPAGSGNFHLLIDYQARANLVGNLDAVAHFHRQVLVQP